MIRPVLSPAEELVAEYGCSRRLAARVGALLARGVGISPVVLEEAARLEGLRELLLERGLLETQEVRAEFARLCGLEAYAAAVRELGLALVEEGGLLIIASADEILVAQGTGGEEAAPAAPARSAALLPTVPVTGVMARPSGGLAAAEAGAAAGESPFSDRELARLRVEIFAGEDSARKVAALRQFAFAQLPDEEIRRVFLLALADEDAQLRQAAVKGLRHLGVGAQMGEGLRLLAEGRQLGVARARLLELCGGAQALECEGLLLLLAGSLRDRSGGDELLDCALEVLAGLVPVLPESLPGLDELVQLLQERLLERGGENAARFRAVFRALEERMAGSVSRKLLAQAMDTGSDEYRGVLLDLLAGLELSAQMREEVLPLVVRTLCRLPVEHASARLLRKLLSDVRDNGGIILLAQSLGECDLAHQRSFIRYLDNCLCSLSLAPATREQIARAAYALLRSAPLQVRADIIETHVLARADISPELRVQAAESLVGNLGDYAHWPLADYLENALVNLGAPAARPLLRVIAERRRNADAALLAKALGRIGLGLEAGQDELAEDILRELARLTFSENNIMDSLHLALGQLASRAGVSREVNAMVMRTLLARLTGTPADAPLLRALGRCCAGNIAQGSEYPAIAALALKHLETEHAAPQIRVGVKDGEEIYSFGEDGGIYAELIPASLEALGEIALAPRVPAAFRNDLLAKLVRMWEDSGSLRVMWGPANVSLLTETLGRIGAAPELGDAQRVMIASALRKRVGSVTAMEALAGIVAVHSRLPQMDKLAGALAGRLLELLENNGELKAEDQEIYLRILARTLARGRLAARSGGAEEGLRLWRRCAEVFLDGIRRSVPGVFSRLRDLLEQGAFPAELAQGLRQEISRFSALSTLNS